MRRGAVLAVLGAISLAPAAAFAQDHSGHAMPPAGSPPPAAPAASADCEAESARHRAMGHDVPVDACSPAAAAPHPHHGATHHPVTPSATAVDRTSTLPSPAQALQGPPRAADAIWGADAMRASRAALVRDHGGMRTFGLIVERAEYLLRDGADAVAWDAKAWYGGDLDRIWLESEGEGHPGDGLTIEEADIALRYGRAISPWFDLRAGVRQTLAGPGRTSLALGISGLAPYLVHIDADLFLSHKGELTAEAEFEFDQRLTQRLILEPRAAIALSAQDVPELGIGAGIDRIAVGARLRYELAREFAPYLGIEHERRPGASGDFARAAGKPVTSTNLVVGVRFWF